MPASTREGVDRPSDVSSPPARRLMRPQWTDARLWIGLALVVVSVVGVTRVVAAASATDQLWMVQQELAAGTTIAADDVALTSVRLSTLTPYLSAAESPVGAVTTRNYAAGELLSDDGVKSPTDAPPLRWLTLPIGTNHLPADLARGQQVDVYVVERSGSGEPVGEPTLVQEAVTVAAVDDGDSRFGGSSLELGIALAVSPSDVASLVAAEASGTLTLVRIPGTS